MHTANLSFDTFGSYTMVELEWTMIKLIYYALGLLVLLAVNWRLLWAKIGACFTREPKPVVIEYRTSGSQTPCWWDYDDRTQVATSNGTHLLADLREELARAEDEQERWRDNYAKWTKDYYAEESMMHGSTFVHAKAPSCQANLVTQVAGREVYIGVAFVMHCGPMQVLLTAGHNTDLISESWEVQGITGVLSGKSSDWKLLPNYDVAYKVLSVVEASTLGLKTAKSGAVGMRDTTVVKCTASAKQSVGEIRNSGTCGLVEYDGSTLKGFSGAPYLIGNTVFGMHVAGTKRKNIGISSGLISLMVQKMESVQLEASEDFYMDEIKQMTKSGQFAWTYSHPLEHDEVIFMDRKGKYHTVDADWFDTLDIEYRERERGFKAEGRLERNKVVQKRTMDVCTETPLFWSYEEKVEVIAEASMELESAVTVGTQAVEKVKTKGTMSDGLIKTRTYGVQTDSAEPIVKKSMEVQTEVISTGSGSFLELTKESADVSGGTELGLPVSDVRILNDIRRNLHRTQEQQTDYQLPLVTVGQQPTPAQPKLVSSSSSTEHSKLEASFSELMKEMREMKRLWEEKSSSGTPVAVVGKSKKATRVRRLREELKQRELELAQLRQNQVVPRGRNGGGSTLN